MTTEENYKSFISDFSVSDQGPSRLSVFKTNKYLLSDVDFIVRIFLSFIPLNNIAGGEISDRASMPGCRSFHLMFFWYEDSPPVWRCWSSTQYRLSALIFFLWNLLGHNLQGLFLKTPLLCGKLFVIKKWKYFLIPNCCLLSFDKSNVCFFLV